MKNITYNAHGPFEPTFRALYKMTDEKETRNTARRALALYRKYLTFHPELKGTARFHFQSSARRAALYNAIRERHPQEAYRLTALSSKAMADGLGEKINRLLEHRPVRAIFLPVMKFVSQRMFGEKGGFENVLVSASKECVRFDILSCPYCRYLEELGCPELTRSFCDSDEQGYGHLSAIAFERTQTLGTGGSKCDFCFRRRSCQG